MKYSPPLTIAKNSWPRLECHMSDIFVRRSNNSSQIQEMKRWPNIVTQAQKQGATEARIGTNASWGSNFLGDFPVDALMLMLEKQHLMWDKVNLRVTSCYFGDPMSWCVPHKVEEALSRIKEKRPDITHCGLHFHNARNMAIASIYAVLRTLGPEDKVDLDGRIGGYPYCGNDRAIGMALTEDVLHMLEGMGKETKIDSHALVGCVWMLEEIIGLPTYGHVSKAGPRPKPKNQIYDINPPFIETLAQAKHFKLGAVTYQGGVYPYKAPMSNPYLDHVQPRLPSYELREPSSPWMEERIPG